MFMKKTLFAIVTVLSAMLAACAGPQPEPDSPSLSRPAPSSVWRVPTQLDLTIKNGAEVSAWRCTYFPDGTTLMESLAPETAGGEILLIGGYALAVRGPIPLRRDVLEIVDDVMLNQQLATLLLQQAAPLGPESIAAAHPVLVDESDAPISTETTNTSRYFSAPWRLRGELRRAAARMAFDLQFEAYPAGATLRNEKYLLSGIWQQQIPAPRIEESFSLKGWSIYRIRMGTRDAGGGITTAAFVTTPDSRRYQTLGELRAALPGASGKQ